jgi:HD-GYP domain
MHNSKGSLILTALSPSADQQEIITYLEKRAKKIPSGKIPTLLQNLPVVLNRSVSQETGMLVVSALKELGADAQFVPFQDETNVETPPQEPDKCDGRTELVLNKFRSFFQDAAISDEQKQIIKPLGIIAAMLAGACLVNLAVTSPFALLGLYTLPTVVAAYFFGQRWAMGTAVASIIVVLLASLFTFEPWGASFWIHMITWVCALLATAYAMGVLHKRDTSKGQELRQTYQGLLFILNHIITHDEKRKNHCFRVSIYASRIATHLGFDKNGIEDIRSAALLHELGRMEPSRSILRKITAQFRQEGDEIENNALTAILRKVLPRPVQDETFHAGGSDDIMNDRLFSEPIGRILPLLIDARKQTSSLEEQEKIAPIGTRVLVVADAYDALTFGHHDRKAVSPEEAHDAIVAESGTTFDSKVVRAFSTAFKHMEMELPTIIL